MDITVKPSTSEELRAAAAQISQLEPGDEIAFPVQWASYVARRCYYLNSMAKEQRYRTQRVNAQEHVWRHA